MKRVNLTFELSDRPDIVDALRILAAHQKKSQKAIFIEAMDAYLAHRQENEALLAAASHLFTEWESEEDKVYDSL